MVFSTGFSTRDYSQSERVGGGGYFEFVECFEVFVFGELLLRGFFWDLFLFGFGGGEVWLCHGSCRSDSDDGENDLIGANFCVTEAIGQVTHLTKCDSPAKSYFIE